MINQSDSREKNVAYSAELRINDDSVEALGQDDKDMARMGKKQEFKRNFNWIGSVGFTSCAMDESIIPNVCVFDADLLRYAPDMSPKFSPPTLALVLTSTLRKLPYSIISKCW